MVSSDAQRIASMGILSFPVFLDRTVGIGKTRRPLALHIPGEGPAQAVAIGGTDGENPSRASVQNDNPPCALGRPSSRKIGSVWNRNRFLSLPESAIASHAAANNSNLS